MLVIAIDRYKDSCHQLLSNAKKDSEELADVLAREYGFKAQMITRLYDEQATRKNILQALFHYSEKITSKDNLLIYYSGHGYKDSHDFGYWIPYEAGQDTTDYISNADLHQRISNIDALHLVLLIDSCFAGTFIQLSKSVMPSRQSDEVLYKKLYEHHSRYVVAAGLAKEEVNDGIPGGHSPFAAGLLHHLRTNKEPFLPVSGLHSLVRNFVSAQPGSTQVTTAGRIRILGIANEGEFVFMRQSPEESIWAAILLEDTSDAYERYAAEYPEGAHIQEAHRKIKEIAAYTSVDRDNPSTFQQFLEDFPDSKYAPEMRQRLQDITLYITLRSEEVRKKNQRIAQLEQEIALLKQEKEAVPQIQAPRQKDTQLAIEEKAVELDRLKRQLAEEEQAWNDTLFPTQLEDIRRSYPVSTKEKWEIEAKRTVGSEEKLEQYLALFPKGKHALAAQEKLRAIRQSKLSRWLGPLFLITSLLITIFFALGNLFIADGEMIAYKWEREWDDWIGGLLDASVWPFSVFVASLWVGIGISRYLLYSTLGALYDYKDKKKAGLYALLLFLSIIVVDRANMGLRYGPSAFLVGAAATASLGLAYWILTGPKIFLQTEETSSGKNKTNALSKWYARLPVFSLIAAMIIYYYLTVKATDAAETNVYFLLGIMALITFAGWYLLGSIQKKQRS